MEIRFLKFKTLHNETILSYVEWYLDVLSFIILPTLSNSLDFFLYMFFSLMDLLLFLKAETCQSLGAFSNKCKS